MKKTDAAEKALKKLQASKSPVAKALKTIPGKRMLIFFRLLALAKECGIDVFKEGKKRPG